MENSNVTAGIQLKSVILKESILQRDSYTSHQYELEFSVKNSGKKRDGFLDVSVNVLITGSSKEGSNSLSISVTMIGIFEKIGDFPLSEREFLGINAPAIVYPFIRQHIRTLSLEAGIGTILLPTINFQRLFNENNKAVD